MSNNIGSTGNIANIGSSHASLTGGVRASSATSEQANARRLADSSLSATRRTGDRVEVSEVAHWLSEMNRLPAIREDKVAAARAAIAQGTLDSDEKLAIAVQRMIDEIG